MKKYFDYYPNKLAKQNNFLKHQKNKNRFTDFCLGKYEHYYKDEANYGYSRNTDHLTATQKIIREYLYSELNIWESWKNSGSNIFDFTQTLIELLKDTDVSDIELEHIKLPYEYLYVDISQANFYFDNEKSIPIEGFYVSESSNDNFDEETTYERVISFDFTGDYIENYNHINQQLMEYVRGFHSYSLYLDPKANIYKVGQSVADAKEIFIKSGIAEEDVDTKLDLYKIHSDFIKHTISLTINCLLYLTLKDKDIREEFSPDLPIHLKSKLDKANTKKRKEFILKEIKANGFTKIKIVGSKTQGVNKFIGSTNRISPHWRRGHWRNQGYGLNHKEEYKLKWIPPTIVNKEKGEPASGHIYNVTD